MADARDAKGPTFHPYGALAAVFTALIFAILFCQFSGPHVPDWQGYANLWAYGGGWLFREGRDPLFVNIIRAARTVLGADGYRTFREILYGFFIIVAARLAYLIRSGGASILTAVAVVVAAFMLKSVVQIREGISFVLVAWPLVAVLKFGRGGWVVAGVGAAVAAFVHIAAAVFLTTWLVALGLSNGPWRLLNSKGLAGLLLAVGVTFGAAVAFAITRTAASLELSLRYLGVDTYVQFTGGGVKYAYWASYGVAVLVMRHQVIGAASGSRRFGFAYLITLGSMILPAAYTACAALVFGQFYMPAVTSWTIRVFFTCMELGLIVVALRGKANWITLGMAIAMIADQGRLLIPQAV